MGQGPCLHLATWGHRGALLVLACMLVTRPPVLCPNRTLGTGRQRTFLLHPKGCVPSRAEGPGSHLSSHPWLGLLGLVAAGRSRQLSPGSGEDRPSEFPPQTCSTCPQVPPARHEGGNGTCRSPGRVSAVTVGPHPGFRNWDLHSFTPHIVTFSFLGGSSASFRG